MFGQKQSPKVLTPEEKILKYRALAESELARAAKAGRLEAQTVHSTRAAAYAALAISYQLTPAKQDSPMPEDVE